MQPEFTLFIDDRTNMKHTIINGHNKTVVIRSHAITTVISKILSKFVVQKIFLKNENGNNILLHVVIWRSNVFPRITVITNSMRITYKQP